MDLRRELVELRLRRSALIDERVSALGLSRADVELALDDAVEAKESAGLSMDRLDPDGRLRFMTAKLRSLSDAIED